MFDSIMPGLWLVGGVFLAVMIIATVVVSLLSRKR